MYIFFSYFFLIAKKNDVFSLCDLFFFPSIFVVTGTPVSPGKYTECTKVLLSIPMF